MLAIIILIILIFALTLPYTSALISRYKMLRVLKIEAKACGFRVRRRSRWVIFSKNTSQSCDLIVSNGQKIYAVKLHSAYYNGRALIADEERGLMWERRIIKSPLYVDPKRSACRRDGKASTVPQMLVPAKIAKDPRLVRVMLVYPSYKEIRKKVGDKEYRVLNGDTLFGRTLYSPSAFWEILRAESTVGETKENQSEEKSSQFQQ